MVVETHLALSALMSSLPTWRWVMQKQRAAIPLHQPLGLLFFLVWAAYSDTELYATVSVSDLYGDSLTHFGGCLIHGLRLWLALIGRRPPNFRWRIKRP